ncbi:MAG: hypothetical protein JW776_05290 [Candidatus Lokiarchaeota archaeon]|nr:hypothetical protein [Candidatus Lokiarchaeota archaeon]
MSEDQNADIRKLMMLISDLRAKDNERYEEHVKFMNEVVTFIKKIADQFNENWKKIQASMNKLNKSIEDSLDTLLTGINPEGIRETSASLKEIMDTMGKSMQGMNLENVMRELRTITGHGTIPQVGYGTPSVTTENIGTEFGKPYRSSEEKEEEPEIYGFVPDHMKKDKKKDKKDPHLIKPSDLFGKTD